MKNNLNNERQIIKKVYLKHLQGINEPIEILETQAIGGNCAVSSQDKSVFCTLNYSFPEDAIDPVYILLKIIDNPSSLVKTSSLFVVETDRAKAECATYLWLKNENKKNPISWKTPYASLEASDFYIRVGSKKFC